jgi:3-oxoacyl-[acyl-carrier-protein] synthase-3
MIGIKAIGSYIPDRVINNYERIQEFETDENFIRDKIGFETLRRKAENEETSDLCVKAYRNMRSHIGFPDDVVDCIVVCTQNPDGAGLPQTSAIVHRKLGLRDEVASFDISLGCSGYIYGICILQSFMDMNGLKNGFLFTADPYSKVLNHSDRNTELLFGDAATCTWLSDQSQYVILKSHFATDGSGWDAIAVDKTSSHLSMKGKDVFMFTMKKVPLQIKQCLSDNALTKDDIGLFIFHQGSKYIVDNLTRKLDLPPQKVPFHAQGIGNTVSSSIPLILMDTIDSGFHYILISGFGVGLSWATTILKKNDMR